MQMSSWLAVAVTMVVVQIVGAGLSPAAAGPNAEAAKKCIRYSYLLYPYHRPGSVRMSGERNNYFRDCMAKDGNVPEPPPPKEPGAATDNFERTTSLEVVSLCSRWIIEMTSRRQGFEPSTPDAGKASATVFANF